MNLQNCKKIIIEFSKKHVIILASLVILGFLPFLYNLNDIFLSDDWDFLNIVQNNHLRLIDYFFTNYLGNNLGGSYRPIINMFWFVGHFLFGLKPFGYHIIALLIHLCNAILLYFIVLLFPCFEDKNKQKFLAIFSILFFVFFPNHSEAVIWVAAVGDILATLFFLSSILFLLLTKKLDKNKKVLFYIFSLISFFFALLSKEIAISLPVIVLFGFIFWIYKNKSFYFEWKKIFLVLSFFLLTGLFFILRYNATGLFFGYYGGGLNFSLENILKSEFSLFLSHFFSGFFRSYLAKLVFENIYFWFGLILTILVVWLFRMFKKKNISFLFFLIIVYFLSTIPVVSFIINYNLNYYSNEGERWAYLPSLFFAIIIGYLFLILLQKLKKIKFGLIFFSIICLLSFGFLFGQLIQKNYFWYQSAKIVDNTLNSLADILNKNLYDGVVIMGLPDNYHGIPMFRNVFKEALFFSTGLNPDMIVGRNRMLYSGKSVWIVERKSQSEFIYFDETNNGKIVSDENFFSSDYSTKLENAIEEIGALNYKLSSSKLILKLSDKFLQTNAKRKIGILFFSPDGWRIFDLNK